MRFTLSISQGSSGYSSVHKVYLEFRVWLFDNNTFPKIQFLTQQLLLSQIGVTSNWWMLQRKNLNSKQKHLARVIQTALTKFLKNNSEWNLFVNLQIIRILSWFTWDFKKTYFAEHSMMAAFIKIKNHLQPPLPNAELAFLFLSRNLIVDSSKPYFFAASLMVAPVTEYNSCKASSNHILHALILTFL